MTEHDSQRVTNPRYWLWLAALIILILTIIAACVAPAMPEPPKNPEAAAEVAQADSDAEVAAGEEATETATPAAAGEAGAGEAAAEAGEPADEAGEPDTATANADELVGAPLPSDETYKGLPVGFTEQGLPYRGDPNAPIVMIEYSDYQCPFCNRYFVQTEPALDEAYVREGQVRVVFFDMPLAQLHPNAPAAHEAALCVAEQGSATRYWEMHSELFRSVEEWETAADPAPIFERLAEEVGADMEQYGQCVAGDEQEGIVQTRVQTAMGRGFSGTPSFQFVRTEDDSLFALVGAQPFDEFAGLLDAVLAGETPQTAQQPEQPSQGIPFWATAAGWAPDPERPGYNMAGDQYRGSVDAPLTIIEFSDFQCPYCKRHVDESQAALDEKYVDTGKVLWVFKHFPLNIHPQAPAAGVAAECAGEQGQFWEMHHLLFADPDSWSIQDPSPVFTELAGQLGLDGEAFAACLENPEMAARVDADLQEGAPYVQGTPTFIIISGQRGSIIPGALPEERFSSVIDEELAALEATPSN